MPPYRIPALSAEDIQIALTEAREVLSSRRAALLRRQLNTALANYAATQLVDGKRRSVTPSKLRAQLLRIKRTAGLAAWGSEPSAEQIAALLRDPSVDAALKEIRRRAIVEGDPRPDLDKIPPERLCELAELAAAVVDGRIEVAKSRASAGKLRERRNTGNPNMAALFGTFNSLWVAHFRRLPGMTLTRDKEGSGPYGRFVRSILRTFSRRIGPDIRRDFPDFHKRLLLSPQAVHGYFRRTGISRFREADSQKLI
jgi:hypothetical protein